VLTTQTVEKAVILIWSLRTVTLAVTVPTDEGATFTALTNAKVRS